MLSMRLFKYALADTNPLIAEELHVPAPSKGQVRIRVLACGVCHTDLHIVEGDIHPPALPITPGHQVVGIIDALGEGVKGLILGDRVGVPWLYNACTTCEYCLRGEENLCPQAKFTGFHTDGGFSEYLLADARYLLPIPVMFSHEQAAPLLCAGIIGYRSLMKADVKPGERLGLVGFGASAHLAIQLATSWGCEVYAFSRSLEHRRLAEELGAIWTGETDDILPKPLDRAILFAPVGYLVPAVLKMLRPGGPLAINAIHMSPIPAMEYELIYGERTVRSIANATYKDGIEFLQLAEKLHIKSSIKEYQISEANQALSDLKYSKFKGEAVLMIQR